MSDTLTVQICREALILIVILSLPALIVSLVVGLVISILQATTQVQEQSLTFVPKIVAVFVVLALAAPWLLKVATNFTTRLYSGIPSIIR